MGMLLLAGGIGVVIWTLVSTLRTDTARCCKCNRQTKIKLRACQRCGHVCSPRTCGADV